MGKEREFKCHRCKGTGELKRNTDQATVCHECHGDKTVIRRVRVLVATANIALQEQLVEKDLPRLHDMLPWDFSWTIFKGKGNYICLDRENKVRGHRSQATLPGMKSSGGDVDDDSWEMKRLLPWANDTETGDKSELDFVPSYQTWGKLSVSADDCKGQRCRHYKNGACWAKKARSAAAASNIIVCNYHILFSHLKFGGTILPPFDVVILDEAHETANIARDFFGFNFGDGAFKRLSRFLEKRGNATAAVDVGTAGEKLFADLKKHATSGAYDVRIRRPDVVPWKHAVKALVAAEDVMREMQSKAGDDDAKGDIEIERNRAKSISDHITSAMTLDDDNMVVSIEIDKSKGRCSIVGKPINVSGLLNAALFMPTPTVVLTSATISTGGNFDYLEREVGIQEPDRLIAESPFTPSQQLFIIPRSIPDPRENDWQDAMVDVIEQCIRKTNGRTLALFTSYKNLNYAYDEISKRINECTIYRQGDKPRTQLVDDFSKYKDSCLFGTTSFWAGVDVPGESLSCVVIDKLPFPSPKNPVLDAIGERLKSASWAKGAFMTHSVPRAIIQFKQGVGRLIRATTDKGVVVCCDKRIATKAYGTRFTKSLDNPQQSRDLDDIARFLKTTPWRSEAEQELDSIPF